MATEKIFFTSTGQRLLDEADRRLEGLREALDTAKRVTEANATAAQSLTRLAGLLGVERINDPQARLCGRDSNADRAAFESLALLARAVPTQALSDDQTADRLLQSGQAAGGQLCSSGDQADRAVEELFTLVKQIRNEQVDSLTQRLQSAQRASGQENPNIAGLLQALGDLRQ